MGTRSITAVILMAAAAVMAAAGGLGAADQPPEAVTVQLFQFKPGQAEVAAGAHVTWTNQDEITHTVTSGTPEQRDGRFRAVLDGKGATAAVDLSEPGVYPYFCERHQSMRGQIRVR